MEPDPARFGDDALYAGGRNEGDHFSVAPAGSDDERDRSSRLCSEPDRFDIPEPPAGRSTLNPRESARARVSSSLKGAPARCRLSSVRSNLSSSLVDPVVSTDRSTSGQPYSCFIARPARSVIGRGVHLRREHPAVRAAAAASHALAVRSCATSLASATRNRLRMSATIAAIDMPACPPWPCPWRRVPRAPPTPALCRRADRRRARVPSAQHSDSRTPRPNDAASGPMCGWDRTRQLPSARPGSPRRRAPPAAAGARRRRSLFAPHSARPHEPRVAVPTSPSGSVIATPPYDRASEIASSAKRRRGSGISVSGREANSLSTRARAYACDLQPRDRLEVRVEHNGPIRAGGFGDQCVQSPLGCNESATRLSVAVVHGDERDAAGLTDPREQGQVGLAAAFDDRDRLSVDVMA